MEKEHSIKLKLTLPSNRILENSFLITTEYESKIIRQLCIQQLNKMINFIALSTEEELRKTPDAQTI